MNQSAIDVLLALASIGMLAYIASIAISFRLLVFQYKIQKQRQELTFKMVQKRLESKSTLYDLFERQTKHARTLLKLTGEYEKQYHEVCRNYDVLSQNYTALRQSYDRLHKKADIMAGLLRASGQEIPEETSAKA